VSVSIASAFHGRVREHEPMSAHTSWRIGGPADMFFTPRDLEDLGSFLRALPPDAQLTWVGLGSNLLVRDGGIRGVVIGTHGTFTRLERLSQTRLYCEAGVPCARIARQCARWQLGEAEFFGGIPGTLGGALAMNAGAFGSETWKHVASVDTIDRRGGLHHRLASEYRISYREVQPPAADEWFIAAELELRPRTAADAEAVRILLDRRRQTQPLGERSCGSVFKNPAGDHAARLIEAAGLKGYRVGDAVVSDKHANFILNEGQARARDVEAVIRHVQDTVQRVHGVQLVPEVRIVGVADAS
jgi:UDP-N-acetylmuramate dehydrogenase